MFSSNTSQVSSDATYIEDVFSTYLYTGNGSTQTITNGIDLAGKGGLTWIKSRSAAYNCLFDTNRGANNVLWSNTTTQQITYPSPFALTSFNANGFSLNAESDVNQSGTPYASWTFRKQPKFFDVVTYTGNGVAGRTVAHNLGSVPGCIIVKSTSIADGWAVYHKDLGATKYLWLQNTNAANTLSVFWNNTEPTATNFTVGTNDAVNQSGATYVAYLFAHDAGGFGLTGTDNVISCGSATSTGSGTVTVNLGYEPQWILIKGANSAGYNWNLFDNMRGVGATGVTPRELNANLSNAEGNGGGINITSTGFTLDGSYWGSVNLIYIAIRRGPMRTPTTGTSVFSPNTTSGAAGTNITTNFPVDLQITRNGARSATTSNIAVDRLRGVSTTTTDGGAFLGTTSTNGESTAVAFTRNWGSTGFQVTTQNASVDQIYWNFRRAPGFFDEVCYTGTGTPLTLNHNLGAAPELIITKQRSGTSNWNTVYGITASTQSGIILNSTGAGFGPFSYTPGNWILNAAPTSTTITIGSEASWNGSGSTYVAYLFASCPGVSKVGSYTGNGGQQGINCGFAGGARFVLIKRTDSTGDWYVWDTARGMVSGTNPYLLLNSTAAEVNPSTSCRTNSNGFTVNQTSGTNINVNGASYIYLAIA